MTRHVRLDVVLRLRELAEETARTAMATALERHLAANRALDLADARVAERAAKLTDAQLTGGTAEDLIAAARDLVLAGRRRADGVHAREIAGEEVLDARSRLAEASQRREVVERLRDRIAAEERLVADRRDAAEATELASVRHAWRGILESER